MSLCDKQPRTRVGRPHPDLCWQILRSSQTNLTSAVPAADRDPGKYCQLAIDELEMALEMYEAEEKMLESSDEDGA